MKSPPNNVVFSENCKASKKPGNTACTFIMILNISYNGKYIFNHYAKASSQEERNVAEMEGKRLSLMKDYWHSATN